MNNKDSIHVGELVRSLAGHDRDRYFLVIRRDGEFVWLCDGKSRKAVHSKRKKIKHVESTGIVCHWVLENPERINNTSVKKAIKKALKNSARTDSE